MVFWRKKKQQLPEANELFIELSKMPAEIQAFGDECVANYQEKRLAADMDFGLGGLMNPVPEMVQWNAEQDTGEFIARTPHGTVEADMQALATYDKSSNTWEWAWNNPHVLDLVKQDSQRIKQYGDEKAISLLTQGIVKMPDDPDMFRKATITMLALAQEISESETVFHGVTGPMTFYLGLKNLKKPNAVAEGETDYANTYYLDQTSCMAGNSLFKRSPEVARVLVESQPEFTVKYKNLCSKWGVAEMTGWNANGTTGTVRIDTPSGEVYADYQSIGSLETSSSTWNWAWGDSAARHELLSDTKNVKQFGEAHGIDYLTEEQFYVDKDSALEFAVGMMAISTKLNDADAAFFPDKGSTRECMTLRNLRRTE